MYFNDLQIKEIKEKLIELAVSDSELPYSAIVNLDKDLIVIILKNKNYITDINKLVDLSDIYLLLDDLKKKIEEMIPPVPPVPPIPPGPDPKPNPGIELPDEPFSKDFNSDFKYK